MVFPVFDIENSIKQILVGDIYGLHILQRRVLPCNLVVAMKELDVHGGRFILMRFSVYDFLNPLQVAIIFV